MAEISFTSTYRIPITQAGVNPAKKEKLRELILSYPNGLIGKSKSGCARVSIPDTEDNNFIRKLHSLKYYIYEMFEGENISKENLDVFIKEKLATRDFKQKGKNPPPLPRKIKEQRRFKRNYTPAIKPEDALIENPTTVEVKPTKQATKTIQTKVDNSELTKEELALVEEVKREVIRKSEGYLKLKEEEGERFAEAVYFGIK